MCGQHGGWGRSSCLMSTSYRAGHCPNIMSSKPHTSFQFYQQGREARRLVHIGFKLWSLWLQSITNQQPHVPHKFYFQRLRPNLGIPSLVLPIRLSPYAVMSFPRHISSFPAKSLAFPPHHYHLK